MDAIETLLTRASNNRLREPEPDAETLSLAFGAALRAPDHALLRPWRVQLIRGQARERFGQVLHEALLLRNPAATVADLEKEAKKPLRAPLVIVVSAPVKPHPKAPAIEQILSAGCAVQNILLALHARGYAGMWRTGAPAYDPHVKKALGLSPEDAIVAFLYAGTPAAPPPAIARPAVSDHVSEWNESAIAR